MSGRPCRFCPRLSPPPVTIHSRRRVFYAPEKRILQACNFRGTLSRKKILRPTTSTLWLPFWQAGLFCPQLGTIVPFLQAFRPYVSHLFEIDGGEWRPGLCLPRWWLLYYFPSAIHNANRKLRSLKEIHGKCFVLIGDSAQFNSSSSDRVAGWNIDNHFL